MTEYGGDFLKEKLLIVLIYIIAAMCVMIIHEFVKSVIYYIYVKREEPHQSTKGIFNIFRYIDPIGVIFSAARVGIFSKQYPYLIKSRKVAVSIGIAGYSSMVLTFLSSIMGYKLSYVSNPHLDEVGFSSMFFHYFWMCMAFFSLMMMIINFFPIVSFDITLILGACARSVYMYVKMHDRIFKGLFLILSFFGVFQNIALVLMMIIIKK